MFWNRKRAVDQEMQVLAGLLSSQFTQATLFKSPQYTQDKNLSDAAKIVAHSKTLGYETWAAEAWLEVVGQIKKITLSKDQREVDQAVGSLRSTLHLLGVSFSASRMLDKQADDKSRTPDRVKQGA